MKKLFSFILTLLIAFSLQAKNNGQFFKKLSGQNVSVENVEQNFSQWFSLPEGTEWREVSRTTDYMGMERIEYRQYVAGVEVEHSQILIHAKDGKVRSANGMVMETRRSPARVRQHNPIYKDDTSVEYMGRKLYLVNSKDGFLYAYKVLSADKREWVYYDAETQQVIKRVATNPRFQAENKAVQVKGTTVYSGEVTLDASQKDDGSTFLYDPVHKVHTFNAAYLPSFSQLNEWGKLWQYFPQGNMPTDFDEATEEQMDEWMEMIEDMSDNNQLEHLGDYIFDYVDYFTYKEGEDYSGYRITDIMIESLFVKDEDGNLVPYTPDVDDDWDDDDDDDWGDDDDDNLFANSGDDDDDDWDDDNDANDSGVIFNLMYGTDPANISKAMIAQFMFDFSKFEGYPVEYNLHQLFEHVPREGGMLYIAMPTDDEDAPVDTLAAIAFVPNESGILEFSNERISFTFKYEPAGHPAADIHWGMIKTLDFYKEIFGRDSYDGNGSPVYNLFYNLPETEASILNFPVDNAAAMATNAPYPMLYGSGGFSLMGLSRPVVELSVMAHEFTHIVTHFTADLEYSGESGALNESFSDIMGISVKKYVTNTPDWNIGEGVMLDTQLEPISNFRDMANPKNSMNGDDPNPDTYEGENWIEPHDLTDGDNGGVHRNSSVQNKWYYLLTDGEEGTNDHGFAYNVEGIGIEKSRQIAYLTLTSYATQESDYAAIRMASQEAAEVLYGANSKELKSVADAWDAVGVAESDITGIEKMYFNEGQAGRIFDLQGRMLNELPTESGVYIVDGKKVIVK